MSIRIGIVGAGAIAREHVRAIRRVPGLEVVAVMDPDPAKAEALAALAGGTARATADVRAILEADDIQAIDVCTPPDRHAALSIASARRGKSVHVEKPAALTLADLEAMRAAARDHGVSLTVGQTARFQPVHREAKRQLDAGAVGRPRVLHVTWYARHLWPRGWRAWQLDPARCGGHLVHNGIHALDLAVWLLADVPSRVFARGWSTFAPEMPTPDSFHIIARFAGGALAVLEIAYALRQSGDLLRRLVVIGDQGSLVHTTQGEDATIESSATADAMVHQFTHWARVLRREEPPLVRWEEARAALAAALAAQQSHERGLPVEVVCP
jgi:predicted dehydrogenase